MFSNIYNPQASLDRINNQIAELERMKAQLPQAVQPNQPITQNFQLAPNNSTPIRYANSIDDVQKDIVIGDTPYFSRDLSVLWIKNTKGDIRSYSLTEIIQKDEKDLMIESLQAQLNELKGMIRNESSYANVDEPSESKESSDVPTDRKSKKK